MGVKYLKSAALPMLALFATGCMAPAPRPAPKPVYQPPVEKPRSYEEARSQPLEMDAPAPVRALPQAPEMPPQGGMQTMPQQDTQSGNAVLALLEDVDLLEGQGDLAQAASRVERGLRIDPKNARLWQRLAEIRLQQNMPQQAESMALKSNAFARGNPGMLSANWSIVAKARELLGNSAGAATAMEKAASYQ